MSTEQHADRVPAFSLRDPATLGLLIALVLALLLAGFATLRWLGAEDPRARENEVIAAAKTLVVNVRNFSHETLERDFDRAVNSLTGEGKKAFAQLSRSEEVTSLIRDLQSSAKATIVKVGVVSAEENRAELLMYGEEVISMKDREPQTQPLWLRVQLERRDGKWLISDMKDK